jgi:hypothetical protein
MRLVQCGCMEDHLHAFYAVTDTGGIRDRTDASGEWRLEHVEPDDLVSQVLQGAD